MPFEERDGGLRAFLHPGVGGRTRIRRFVTENVRVDWSSWSPSIWLGLSIFVASRQKVDDWLK